MRIIVKCPCCGNQQKMQTKNVIKAYRNCVYCGKRFKVHTSLSKSTII